MTSIKEAAQDKKAQLSRVGLAVCLKRSPRAIKHKQRDQPSDRGGQNENHIKKCNNCKTARI